MTLALKHLNPRMKLNNINVILATKMKNSRHQQGKILELQLMQ
jgi:hypothetical protein